MLAGQKQTDFQGTLRTCSPILVAKTPFFSKIANSTQTNIFFFIAKKTNLLAPYWSIASTFSIFTTFKVSTLVSWKAVTFSVVGTCCVLILLVFDDNSFSLLTVTLLFAVKNRVRLHQDDF